jgi:hypothetical protein
MKQMKPECQIVTATKPLVDSLLAMNTENRPIRKAVVDRYKRDILAGKWFLTNQGIGISQDGVMIDGQHRLAAIRECGYPQIPILIVSGLDREARKAVDQHAKRSARDLLAFSFNARVSRAAPAIAAVLFRNSTNWRMSPTNQEIYDIITDNREEMESVIDGAMNKNFFAAPFSAAFVISCKDHGVDRTLLFMRSVEVGEMLTKEMPEFHLRNFIITNRKTTGGGSMQRERFEKCMKAIAAHMEGRKMGVLRL